jgi:hypothetical protein
MGNYSVIDQHSGALGVRNRLRIYRKVLQFRVSCPGLRYPGIILLGPRYCQTRDLKPILLLFKYRIKISSPYVTFRDRPKWRSTSTDYIGYRRLTMHMSSSDDELIVAQDACGIFRLSGLSAEKKLFG